MKTASVQDRLSVILDETQKIIDNSNSFLLLYDMCRSDELLSDISFLEFSASFSEFNNPTASLSFLSFIDISQCMPNPYMSEFSGNILFTSSTVGITATINICFSEMFSDPEKAFEVFKKYDYLEKDSIYTRRLDNTKAGDIEISGQLHFNFSTMSKITNVEDMITLCKATFREMNKYLCNKEWTEMKNKGSLKIIVEKCEECGKREEFRGSYDDCVRFCRECISKMGDDELDEVCKYCSGCDTE